jgi:hypothetical protein
MAKQISPVGAALVVWGEAVEMLDRVYEAQDGEVTEESEAVEWWAAMTADAALEAVCRFWRFLEHGELAIESERKRLDKAAARIAARKAWIGGIGLQLLESLDAKSKAAGPFRAKSRVGGESLKIDEAVFKLDEAPDEILRTTEPVPATTVVDKTKAKALLKRQDTMPVPGLSIERGPSSFSVD